MATRWILAAFLILAALCPAQAQEAEDVEGTEDEVDALFDEDTFESFDEEGQAARPQDDVLKTGLLSWSGRISGSMKSEWVFPDPLAAGFDPAAPEDQSLEPALESLLSFDARPESDFRVYGRFRIRAEDPGGALAGLMGGGGLDVDNLPEGWTSEENEDGDLEIRNPEGVLIATVAAEDPEGDGEEKPGTGTTPSMGFQVTELFSEFSWKDSLFFKFGKHTIQWGVGYFFSPADVLNLTAIDEENPAADREGPVSLRIHMPFDVHNAYLYLIPNLDAKPLELAVAPMVEAVFGLTEIGIGAYYQQALAPRAVALLSTTVGDVDFFAEGVASFGSDRTFVARSRDQSAAEEDPEDDLEVVLDTFEVKDIPFFSATLGFRYQYEFEEAGSLSLLGQYFFNGEGYADSSLLRSAAYLLRNADENGLVIADEDARPQGYEDPPALAASDLNNFGRHYAALSMSLSRILDSDFSLSLLGIANLSDLSGIAQVSLSWKLFDYLTVSLGTRLTLGALGAEYTNPGATYSFGDPEAYRGPTFGLSITASAGSGRF